MWSLGMYDYLEVVSRLGECWSLEVGDVGFNRVLGSEDGLASVLKGMRIIKGSGLWLKRDLQCRKLGANF